MNMLDRIIEDKKFDSQEEVIIGLVGAAGSSMAVFQNILKSELEEVFDFEVFVIKISEDILIEHPNAKDIDGFSLDGKYKRIMSLMDLGNNLRKCYGYDYIALEIAKNIKK